MNLLLASVLFAIVISQLGIPQTNLAQIQAVIPGSPADIAGFKSKDIFVLVNGEKVNSVEQVIRITQANLGKSMNFVLKRDGQEISVQVTPRLDPPEGEGPLGVILTNPVTQIGFFQAVPLGVQTTYDMLRQLLSLPAMLINGQVDSSQMRLISPKGMYDIYSQVRTESEEATNNDSKLVLLNMVIYFGIISAGLGFTNLLPIPAADGGRIFFMLPELLFNKRVPPKFENAVHAIGFSILMAIMIMVFIQDFINPVVLPK